MWTVWNTTHPTSFSHARQAEASRSTRGAQATQKSTSNFTTTISIQTNITTEAGRLNWMQGGRVPQGPEAWNTLAHNARPDARETDPSPPTLQTHTDKPPWGR
eukprot:scaffold159397_cov33-Tisochrysis_lutea.AAC.1